MIEWKNCLPRQSMMFYDRNIVLNGHKWMNLTYAMHTNAEIMVITCDASCIF